MNLRIDVAKPEHVKDIVRLMCEFAAFENLAQYCTITEEKLHEVMFTGDNYVKGVVAIEDDRIIAYALFYKYFASFRGQCGYYLEDLFIDGSHRGVGVGEMILRKIARIAKSEDLERIDFLVLDWNTPAVSFYEKLGAIHSREEIHFKFIDESFASLAE